MARITEIRAGTDSIRIALEGAAEGKKFRAEAHIPTVCGDPDAAFAPGRAVFVQEAECRGGALALPRFGGEWDLLVCRFEVWDGGAQVPGVCFVTETDPGASAVREEFPKRPIKAICSSEHLDLFFRDVDELGAKVESCGFDESCVMAAHPGPETIAFRSNGKDFFFKKDVVGKLDREMRGLAQRGIPVTLGFCNSIFTAGKKADEEIVDVIIHPAYDYDYPAAYKSAFNLRTEAGLEHFIACVDFHLARYAAVNRENGWAVGLIVGNEVTSAYIWNNQGEMTVDGAMQEYASALRIAWLLSRKYASDFRVYTSFDQYFSGRHVPDQPKRFYGMRECIDAIEARCAAEGDFPWNVATHPYPESLSYPDFWNDREPRWNFETRRITFKNIEVLPAYLAQERLLYKGKPRHVTLNEEGFNTRTADPYTELQAKYGYVLAYLKIRRLQSIDMFMYYSYMDNPWEFGLNLGLRYFGGYENGDVFRALPGPRKPVCDAIAAMDTPREAEIVREARAYIGPDLFDAVLNPPPVAEKAPHNDGLTIPGQGVNNARGRAAMKRREAGADNGEHNFDT